MIKDELKKLKDITNELIRVDYNLLLKEKQWETLFKSVPEYTFITDSDFNIMYINKILMDKLDVSTNPLIGSNCFEVFKEIKSKDVNDNKLPIFFKCLNGWYLYTITSIKEDEYIVGYVCMLHDYNEVVAIKKELSKANTELIRIKEECGMQLSA